MHKMLNHVIKNFALALCISFLGCGPSSEEIGRLADERISVAQTAVPTPTSIQFPTPLPTPTPVTFPSTPIPQPTPTPQPTATPQPTSTPVIFPPTPTPIKFQPTPTPQPTATPEPIVDLNAVYLQSWPSVFFIETSGGHGSGWLVEPGLILTNEHVVAGSSTVTVRQSGDPPFVAVVVALDSVRDIALLRFDVTGAQLHPRAAPLSLANISTGDVAQWLLALGYSEAGVKADSTVGSATVNVGVLSQIINFGSDSFGLNLIMDAPVDPGDSGGPVLNSEGLVVGMVKAVREQTVGGQRVVGTFFAVHVDEIRDALPSLKNGQSR